MNTGDTTLNMTNSASTPLSGSPISVSTLEDIEALEATPLEQAIPYRTTQEVLQSAAEQYAQSTALSFLMSADVNEEAVTWSYRQLLEDITRAANVFHSLGARAESPVSIIMPNLPETHFALWGAQFVGVANPINPLLEPEHIAGIIAAAGSEIVVTIASIPGIDIGEKAVAAANSVPGVKHVLLVDPLQYLPEELASALAASRAPVEDQEGGAIFHDFHALTSAANPEGCDFERVIDGDDIASLFHTGGTTGIPKLARHSHLNEAFEAWIVNQLRQPEQEESVLCGLPLFHVNGAVVTGLAAFASGANVILATPQGYRAEGLMDSFWKLIEKYQITSFSCVPTILSVLLEKPVDADIGSLKYAMCGAAPMSPSVFSQFEELTGVKIIEGYGLTEGTCVSCLNPVDGERKVGSVGLRLPYQELKCAELGSDGSISRFCQNDEIGEVIIRGPNVFPGYTEEERNAGVLLEGGWLATGDLGRLDADGYLWLTGREKDLIIRGGHNIDPAMIENVLDTHPAVAMTAAVGQLDRHSGEVPVAFVMLKDNYSCSEDELLELCRSGISERAAIPTRIEILNEIPLTAVGKTFKPTLRLAAARTAIAGALEHEGLPTDSLELAQDSKFGLSASIRVNDSESLEAVRSVVQSFTVHTDVDLVDSNPHANGDSNG